MEIEILNKFNDKVDRLSKSRFVEWASTKREKPHSSEALSKDWLALDGLHKDEIDGFILNFRFLIQQKDGFSIDCLKKFYEELPADFEDEKCEFHHIELGLNNFLNQKSLHQIQNSNFSNKDFFEIIFMVVWRTKTRKNIISF